MTRSSPLLTAALLAGLAHASPVLAGGTVVTTVQPGSWLDPAVWDLGAPPSPLTGDQAQLQHEVTVDAPGAETHSLTAESGGFTSPLRLVDGGTLVSSSARISSLQAAGSIEQSGGTADLGELIIGSTEHTGLYRMTGGTLTVDTLDVGTPFSGPTPGSNGYLMVLGPDAAVTAAFGLDVNGNGSSLQLTPAAAGAAGFTPISTGDVSFHADSSVLVSPAYPAEVGDRWDLISYSGTLSGTINLQTPPFLDIVVDTSVPGLVSAEVVGSPYPVPNDTCATAQVLDPLGEEVLMNLLGATAAPADTPCFLTAPDVVGADRWFSLTNPEGHDRLYDLELDGVQTPYWSLGLEVWDGCGGTVVACKDYGIEALGPDSELPLLLPAGETRYLRVASAFHLSDMELMLQVHLRGLWEPVGEGLAGTLGIPVAFGEGDMIEGTGTSLAIDEALPLATAGLFVSSGAVTPVPFKQGTLHLGPGFLLVLGTTNDDGWFELPTFPWPAGVPGGFELTIQGAVADPGAPAGVALTAGLRGIAP